VCERERDSLSKEKEREKENRSSNLFALVKGRTSFALELPEGLFIGLEEWSRGPE
jgi:hypothetical protein